MPKHGVFTETTKWCNHCKEHKPHCAFSKSKSTVSKLAVFCRLCMSKKHGVWRRKNLAHVAKNLRKRRAKNPKYFRDYGRKHAYGLEMGGYDRMLTEQAGKCKICQTTDPKGKGSFHVDHCHSTGVIRGLLCHHCNLGLGHFQNSPTLLHAAISYLAESTRES